MTLSRLLLALTLVNVAGASVPAVAQDAVDPEVRRQAIDAYNTATVIEREARESGSDAGPGEHALQECMNYALRSYRAMRSLLASWRIASCASGLRRHLTAFLAFRAFDGLGPDTVLTWTHGSIESDERVRVIAAYAGIDNLVGAARLADLAEGQRVEWPGGAPVPVSPGEIPESNTDVVLLDGALYAPVGRVRIGQIVGDDQEPRRFEIRFRPLSSGIQEVVLTEPEAEHPVIQEPEPIPIARAAPPPMPAATQRAPRPVMYVEEAGGASGLATLGWTGVVVGALGAGSGVLLWRLADSIRQDLDAACPTRTGCSAALRSDYERGRDLTLGGNILTIAGGALAALGVVFLVIDVATTSDATVTVRASATRVELQVGGAL